MATMVPFLSYLFPQQTWQTLLNFVLLVVVIVFNVSALIIIVVILPACLKQRVVITF